MLACADARAHGPQRWASEKPHQAELSEMASVARDWARASRGLALADPFRGGGKEMLAVIYTFGISVVAGILFVAVNEFEPDRLLALALKFVIVFVGVAAVAGRLTQSSADGLSTLIP